MNTYHYYTLRTKDKLLRIVYCITDDIIFTTNLKEKTVAIHFNNTSLPKNCKSITYEDYIRLLTYYKCIK